MRPLPPSLCQFSVLRGFKAIATRIRGKSKQTFESVEIFELLCSKLHPIICNQFLWEGMCSKHGAQGIYGCFSSCTGHAQHFQPFGLSIDDHQKRSALEWTAEVHMHSLPRAVWPNPRVLRSNWCFTVRGLTNLTSPH